MLGNLVRFLPNKTDRYVTVNYNFYILVFGDVHRHRFDIKTKKQKLKYFLRYAELFPINRKYNYGM